ncbi:LysR family transcriptional regulator [Streptomyces sp. NPDC047315]|uniref:LysR family transcriptional regulator n=1 Tax=Streptomyces sp. NPDC047315 TaxID=3155142 RepID=UPI0033F527A6
MERRHLAYFLATVEAGSISAAARQLHLSQPSVSQAIRELERELRTPLVVRGRKLTLTPAGRALIGPARRTLRAFDGVRAAVEEVDRLAAGQLDLTVVPACAVDPAVRLITAFRERYPGVRVRVREAANGTGGFDSLRRAEAELLLHDHPAPYPKHRAVPVAPGPLMAVFPPGTHLPDGPVGLAELSRHEVVMGASADSAVGTWISTELAASGLPALTVAVDSAHRDAVVHFVLAGAGATVLPESAARPAGLLGAVIRDVDFTVPRHCFLYHRIGPLSPAARALVALAEERAENPPARD